MLRVREGVEGIQAKVVPLDFVFNPEAIKGYLSPDLSEGILSENIIRLLEMGCIEYDLNASDYYLAGKDHPLSGYRIVERQPAIA